MHPSNFPSQLREEERKMKRTQLISNLPYIIVLLSEDHGETYGYKVMKVTKEDFKVPTSTYDVYHLLEKLEKQNVLSSTDVISDGRYRKLYRPVEPNASELLRTYFRAKDGFDSEIDKLRSRIERNNSGIQVMTCVPDATTRCNKWINKWRVNESAKGLA